MKIIKYIQKIKYLYMIFILFIINCFLEKIILLNCHKNTKKIINPFLNIQQIKNYGFIFGFFEEKIKEKKVFFYSINIIFSILIILLIYLLFKINKRNKLNYIFLISGALGNLYDRLKYGYVIDFIDCHYKMYHLPIFNISDINIFFSLLLLII
ncbi:signal peptidase II [Buchnera aphidicola]|uniref:signal peptidase II n=1 Tax=Buchnera aphidicola TaxID=9 RepID=UPI003463DAC0